MKWFRVRSQVAIKIFGDDLSTLQKLGAQIGQILSSMKGSNDLRIEQISVKIISIFKLIEMQLHDMALMYLMLMK
jgi:Cu/Ag efflux pump CusA